MVLFIIKIELRNKKNVNRENASKNQLFYLIYIKN